MTRARSDDERKALEQLNAAGCVDEYAQIKHRSERHYKSFR